MLSSVTAINGSTSSTRIGHIIVIVIIVSFSRVRVDSNSCKEGMMSARRSKDGFSWMIVRSFSDAAFWGWC